MSALSLRLPNSLHARVRELARREGISINQFVATALAEKLSALLTEEYLEARARRGSRRKFLAVLDKVPGVEPEPRDRVEDVVPVGRVSEERRRPRAHAKSSRGPRGG